MHRSTTPLLFHPGQRALGQQAEHLRRKLGQVHRRALRPRRGRVAEQRCWATEDGAMKTLLLGRLPAALGIDVLGAEIPKVGASRGLQRGGFQGSPKKALQGVTFTGAESDTLKGSLGVLFGPSWGPPGSPLGPLGGLPKRFLEEPEGPGMATRAPVRTPREPEMGPRRLQELFVTICPPKLF
eukprot:5133136-Pyramimonas_sp.AAC.1